MPSYMPYRVAYSRRDYDASYGFYSNTWFDFDGKASLEDLKDRISEAENISKDSLSFCLLNSVAFNSSNTLTSLKNQFDPDTLFKLFKIVITEKDELRTEANKKTAIRLGAGLGLLIGTIIGTTGYCCTHKLAALWFISNILICSAAGGALNYNRQTPLFKTPIIWAAKFIYFELPVVPTADDRRSKIFKYIDRADKKPCELWRFPGCYSRNSHHRDYIGDVLNKINDAPKCVVTQDIYNAFYKLVQIKKRDMDGIFWRRYIPFLLDKLSSSNLLTQENLINFFQIHEKYLEDAIDLVLKHDKPLTIDDLYFIIGRYTTLDYKLTELTDYHKDVLSRGYYRHCLFSHEEHNPVQIDAEVDEFAKITQAYFG